MTLGALAGLGMLMRSSVTSEAARAADRRGPISARPVILHPRILFSMPLFSVRAICKSSACACTLDISRCSLPVLYAYIRRTTLANPYHYHYDIRAAALAAMRL